MKFRKTGAIWATFVLSDPGLTVAGRMTALNLTLDIISTRGWRADAG